MHVLKKESNWLFYGVPVTVCLLCIFVTFGNRLVAVSTNQDGSVASGQATDVANLSAGSQYILKFALADPPPNPGPMDLRAGKFGSRSLATTRGYMDGQGNNLLQFFRLTLAPELKNQSSVEGQATVSDSEYRLNITVDGASVLLDPKKKSSILDISTITLHNSLTVSFDPKTLKISVADPSRPADWEKSKDGVSIAASYFLNYNNEGDAVGITVYYGYGDNYGTDKNPAQIGNIGRLDVDAQFIWPKDIQAGSGTTGCNFWVSPKDGN